MEFLGEDGYRLLYESAPDGIVVVDGDGRIVDLNSRAEEMFGYEREELRGETVEVLVPERSRDVHREERREYHEDPRRRPMGIGMELTGRRKDGSEFPVEISLSPVESRRGHRVMSVVRDVSERERLREFGAGALRAAEEERRRIARELHDDTAQRLAGLVIRLRLAQQAEDAGRQDELLEAAREEILETTESVRRIARGLRPPALEDAGVASAIRWYVRSQLQPAGLEADLELDLGRVDEHLSGEEKLTLYRVVQEALSNVVRHADASRIRVEVGAEEGRVFALVEDDGRGFDVDHILSSVRDGLGLQGMEERAHLVQGELTIESEPGSGTRVRLEVPARATEEQNV